MKIILASDSDPESHAAWSGITRSILLELRREGHEVRTVNVELQGARRLAAAAATVSGTRDRWRARYTLGRIPFALRSAAGFGKIGRLQGWATCGIQVGATFHAFRRAAFPYFLCCDSNIKIAIQGRATGVSHGSVLTPRELTAVVRREASVYSGASGIFTLSERLRQSFIEDFGIAPDKVHRMGAGPNFDLARVPGRKSTETAGRRPPTILFIGAQFVRKGGDALLQAFGRVRAAIPEARLVLVGPEKAPPAMEGVEFRGYLDKDDPAGWNALVEAYQGADVFCLPTRFEPFGIAFVEAMHFGLPCVGTAINAVPEILVDGETGYLVPVDDEAALAERLVFLLRNPAEARRLGAAGLRRAQALFTWPGTVSRMTAVMEQALARRREAV